MTSIKGWWIKQTSCCFQLKTTMKLTLILLLFLWDNVEFTLTQKAFTCKLGFIPPEETTYSPQNQIIFRVGQTVMVSCGEKHWVKSTEHQSAELTCLDTGDWDFQPLCRPVTCSKNDERIKHVNSWQRTRFNTVNMNETLTYQCRTNYVETSPGATCTRRGWEPNPLCEEISCPVPPLVDFVVEGEKTEYKENEFLTYNCNYGYRKMDGPSQCKKVGQTYQWIPMPRCQSFTCKLSFNPPEETTYSPQNQIIFQVGQTVNVSCGEKHWVKNIELQSAELTCLEDTGDWDFEPLCQSVTCSKDDERIKHVYSWQRTRFNTVNMDETLTYQCQRNYVPTSPGATCTRRGWEPNPLCEDSSQ